MVACRIYILWKRNKFTFYTILRYHNELIRIISGCKYNEYTKLYTVLVTKVFKYVFIKFGYRMFLVYCIWLCNLSWKSDIFFIERCRFIRYAYFTNWIHFSYIISRDLWSSPVSLIADIINTYTQTVNITTKIIRTNVLLGLYDIIFNFDFKVVFVFVFITNYYFSNTNKLYIIYIYICVYNEIINFITLLHWKGNEIMKVIK